MDGRPVVNAEDLRRVVLPTLRHRMVLRYHAKAEGIEAEDVLLKILGELPPAFLPPGGTQAPLAAQRH